MVAYMRCLQPEVWLYFINYITVMMVNVTTYRTVDTVYSDALD